MSCRIFGRELENVFLSNILKKDFKKYNTCKIKFFKGPKNFLVKEFLNNFGFKEKKTNNFSLDMKKIYDVKNLKIKCKWT